MYDENRVTWESCECVAVSCARTNEHEFVHIGIVRRFHECVCECVCWCLLLVGRAPALVHVGLVNQFQRSRPFRLFWHMCPLLRPQEFKECRFFICLFYRSLCIDWSLFRLYRSLLTHVSPLETTGIQGMQVCYWSLFRSLFRSLCIRLFLFQRPRLIRLVSPCPRIQASFISMHTSCMLVPCMSWTRCSRCPRTGLGDAW